MILDRYLAREIGKPLLIVLGVLAILFGSFSAARFLSDAVNGLLPTDTIAALIALKVLIALEVLIPISLYLSVMLAYGRLHSESEITAVLAETVGSFASLMCIDLDKYYAVGSMIIANHLRPASEGFVTATCKPVHLGRTKHVWDIPIHADNGKIIAKCELTCAVTDKRKS